MVLLIRDEDVREAFAFEDVIEAVEYGYYQHGKGLVQDTPRREVRIKGKDLTHVAPGTTAMGQGLTYLEEPNIIMLSHFPWFQEVRSRANVFPYYRVHPNIIHLIDGNDGNTLAVIRSPYAIWMRTAAASAVGAKYLARKDTATAGVIGTGGQGRGQLLLLSKVIKIEKAFAFSGRRKDEKYAREMSDRLGIEVVATDGPEEVVRNADVLITATPSTEPIVRSEWVIEGTHISSIGADDPKKVELDAATFKKADKIVIDSEFALTKIGQIAIPIEQGILKPEDIYGTIGKVVAGLKPGRQNNREITIFASEGTNMQTASVAYKVYRKVKEKGLGIETSTLFQYFMI